MPEGPSILHLKNKLLPFKGKIVRQAGGYGPMPTDWMKGKKLLDICTWGKHLLFVFNKGTARIHLGLFGEVLINERKTVNRAFFLEFASGEINGYVVKAEKLTAPVAEVYDWRTDILHKDFSPAYVKQLVKTQSDKTIDDVLMDQQIFTGVGNIIRNEALYRAGIHPLSVTGKIPAASLTQLIKRVAKYAHLFYNNLEKNGVNKSFSVYRQKFAADGSEVTMKVLPRTKRKVFFSEHKQVLFN